jgi:hypothetical protein
MTIAWYDPTNHHVSTDKNDPLFTPLGQVWPLYPKRAFVGLTDEDQSFVYDQVKQIVGGKPFWVKFADAIEARLKELNS